VGEARRPVENPLPDREAGYEDGVVVVVLVVVVVVVVIGGGEAGCCGDCNGVVTLGAARLEGVATGVLEDRGVGCGAEACVRASSRSRSVFKSFCSLMVLENTGMRESLRRHVLTTSTAVIAWTLLMSVVKSLGFSVSRSSSNFSRWMTPAPVGGETAGPCAR